MVKGCRSLIVFIFINKKDLTYQCSSNNKRKKEELFATEPEGRQIRRYRDPASGAFSHINREISFKRELLDYLNVLNPDAEAQVSLAKYVRDSLVLSGYEKGEIV
jgi:hypothetical protein